MKVTEVKGNTITLDLSDKEYNSLFRAGLQLLLDKWFGKKVIVLPVDKFKKDKDTKTLEIDDEIGRLCIEAAVCQALREHIDKVKTNKVKTKKEKPSYFIDDANYDGN